MGIVTPKALSLSHWKYQDLKEHVIDALTSDKQVARFRCLCILLDRWGGSEFRDRPPQGPLSTQIRVSRPGPGGSCSPPALRVRAVQALDRLHRRDLDAEARKPDISARIVG